MAAVSLLPFLRARAENKITIGPEIIERVVERLTALIQSNEIEQPGIGHTIVGAHFWARQSGFNARSAFSAAVLVTFIAQQVDARLIETGLQPKRLADVDRIWLIRQRLIATVAVAGMRAADKTSRWTTFARVLLPLIFEENHTVFRMLESGKNSSSLRPNGMFLAPLVLEGASLLSEPAASAVKMMTAKWAALYSPAAFSFSVDHFFPLIRLLFAQNYILWINLFPHSPTGSRLTFKLYDFRRERMQTRKIGPVVARFFPAEKIMELGESSNESSHELITEAKVQGMPDFFIDKEAIDLSAQSLWTIRNAPRWQHPAVRIFAVWNSDMQAIVRRAFPQETLAELRAAFEEQVRLQELLRAWVSAMKQLHTERLLYRRVNSFTRSPINTEGIMVGYAAHLGAIALGGMPDFHLMDLVTRLPLRNAVRLNSGNVMAARLIADLLVDLPSIRGGKTYGWHGKVLMNQAEGMMILKAIASSDSNRLRQELAAAARRLYARSFGELPEWQPSAIVSHSTSPRGRLLALAV